jgi:phage tail protein X
MRPTYPAVLALTLTAALCTVCLNAPGLAAWTATLPEGLVSSLAGTTAHRLEAAMTSFGISRPASVIHDSVRSMETKRFTEDQDR